MQPYVDQTVSVEGRDKSRETIQGSHVDLKDTSVSDHTIDHIYIFYEFQETRPRRLHYYKKRTHTHTHTLEMTERMLSRTVFGTLSLLFSFRLWVPVSHVESPSPFLCFVYRLL